MIIRESRITNVWVEAEWLRGSPVITFGSANDKDRNKPDFLESEWRWLPRVLLSPPATSWRNPPGPKKWSEPNQKRSEKKTKFRRVTIFQRLWRANVTASEGELARQAVVADNPINSIQNTDICSQTNMDLLQEINS